MSAQPETVGGVSKPLIYALAGLSVLALVGVFVILPLMAGGDDTPADPVVAVVPTDAPGEQPVPEPTLEPELPPIGETFEVFSARDPFQQLVKDSSGGGEAVVGGDPTSNGGDTPTESPSDPAPGTPGSGDPGANPPPDSVTEDGTTVVIEDVFVKDGVEYVLLTANGKAYTLTEGDTFATNWRVEAIDDPCVTLLYGDQARLVCEGESIRK